MEFIEKRLVKNFLSRSGIKNNALYWSLGTLLVCLVMSNLYWYSPIGEYLAASPEKVFGAKEYWRLFTSSFIHGDMGHFLSNSVMLSFMGYFVAYHLKAWTFPVLSFLSGILINLIVIWNFPQISRFNIKNLWTSSHLLSKKNPEKDYESHFITYEFIFSFLFNNTSQKRGCRVEVFYHQEW